jgi:hypothetical protein
MRYRLMASFQGASYQAGVGPTDEEVTLFAACPPPEELGFRSSSNHWRKSVSVDELDALWEARPIGRYRGERCMVLDDLGDRMHIAYLGRDLYLARRLGFWEVDRGVFEVVVPRQDIDGLREERGEYELAVLDRAGGNGHGGWDTGSRETWAFNPRDYNQPAPDTGPLRAVGRLGLIDTGPSWAADPRPADGPGPGRQDVAGEHAQDPRDTGTWAAIGDPQDAPEPGGPFPRARGGWRARDTGGWQAPDTGSWDPREVERAAARERAAVNGWNGQNGGQNGGWNGAQNGGWNDRAPDRTPDRWGTPAGSGTGSWNQRDATGTGGWNAHDVTRNGDWNAHDVTDPGLTAGAWSSQDVTATNPGQWDQQDTMAWNPVTAGEWDHDGSGWNGQGRPGGPVGPGAHGADWEPDEVVRSAYPPPQTQDAAAVWHGSPFPGDAGRWSPPAAVPPAAPPPATGWGSGPLAISGADAAPATGVTASSPGQRYDDPPLARQAAAITGAYAAPTPSNAAAPPAPAPAQNSTPSPTGAGGGSRYVGRRSARKPRVTTQAIFAQLLDLASIPQSSYAVDTEVDGAMCLIRARGGYEVFSAAEQSRHEVRFFEDEEAAYFYLFGVLAADAIRNGQLGPRG